VFDLTPYPPQKFCVMSGIKSTWHLSEIGHGTLRSGAVACLMAAEAAMPVGWVGLVSPFPGNSDHRKIKMPFTGLSS
jgi:hypothetical protein